MNGRLISSIISEALNLDVNTLGLIKESSVVMTRQLLLVES
jgi:hypothetical protein